MSEREWRLVEKVGELELELDLAKIDRDFFFRMMVVFALLWVSTAFCLMKIMG